MGLAPTPIRVLDAVVLGFAASIGYAERQTILVEMETEEGGTGLEERLAVAASNAAKKKIEKADKLAKKAGKQVAPQVASGSNSLTPSSTIAGPSTPAPCSGSGSGSGSSSSRAHILPALCRQLRRKLSELF
ncbi:hypothetical protein PG996_016101 [Apiospora saccharicola]|uniref:Uncharacterized protein n=1 Tax=Apiospora saccharicola TaxID=335842 RepID=A0ABR1TNK5_9PEZI